VVSDGDKWPAILIVAVPTWLGQPSSVSKRALERMDALLSETKPDGSPIAQDRVAGVVVVGDEDGALNDRTAARNLLRTARALAA
jgi:multimeric flavodoxin WrbA